jgi:hypothetical protein
MADDVLCGRKSEGPTETALVVHAETEGWQSSFFEWAQEMSPAKDHTTIKLCHLQLRFGQRSKRQAIASLGFDEHHSTPKQMRSRQ